MMVSTQREDDIVVVHDAIRPMLKESAPMFRHFFPYHLFSRGDRIAIYGAGDIGWEFFQQAKRYNYITISCIVDARGEAAAEDGFPVRSIEALKDENFDYILIAIHDEIIARSVRKNLRDMGYSNSMIKWDGKTYHQGEFYRNFYFKMLDVINTHGIDHKKYLGEVRTKMRAKTRAIDFEFKFMWAGRNSFYIFGRADEKLERKFTAYLGRKALGYLKPIGNYFFVSIPYKDILAADAVHNVLTIGTTAKNSLQGHLSSVRNFISYYTHHRMGEYYLLIRNCTNSANIRVTKVKYSEEFAWYNRCKIFIAKWLSRAGKPFFKPLVLLFEKETNKADESGFYIFEKLMEEKKLKREPYFVLDGSHPDFIKLKKKYGKNLVRKHSFRHYLYIFLSDYFISSELSKHCINSRCFISSLNKVIIKKPLVFLQHGIMFAKPVDNPAAAGFRKENKGVNFYKCVISSYLEATQFYKLGYNDEDLIKCGLPKFDKTRRYGDSEKILVMLTYRYWEEALVMDESKAKDTTYFKCYLRIVEAIDKMGKLDELLICSHPKFLEYLEKSMPRYRDHFCTNIDHALGECKIFITDYSSASYDAHYRGSYVIYYWEERDYLIENYKAIPPINEENCDGVAVYSCEELQREIKRAIERNYVMEDIYEEHYRAINEFHDGKNGERLVKALKEMTVV